MFVLCNFIGVMHDAVFPFIHSFSSCTALGTEEKNPGNNQSDAVCKQQLETHPEDSK